MSVNSVRNLVEIANKISPQKVAIVDKNTQLTYAEVYTKVNQIASYLNGLGLKKGSRIGIYSNKSAQKVIALFAVLSTEYVMVPITRLLKADQVQHIIDDCEISCMITDEKKFSTLKETNFGGPILTLDSFDKDLLSFDEIYKCYPSDYTCSIKGYANAAITYSFASSGFPRGVVISHKNLLDGARVVNNYLDISSDDIISGMLSFSFDYGLNQIFSTFYARATFAIYTFFTPSDFFNHLINDKVTILGAMPVHFGLMFDEDIHRLPSPEQLDHVKIITSSGGNVTTLMLTKIEQFFTKASFYSMNGHTEAFRSTYLEPSQLKIRPNSIGKAIPDVELYIINDEGNECKPREVGQLIHRGSGIYKGFWGSKKDTDNSFKSIRILENVLDLENGLIDEIVVATGDYVYKDEDGYLFFVCRHDNMIKTSGYRINPVEIETVVYDNFPMVEKCAVFGIENEIIEEEIVLVYSANGELTKKEILFELKKHLPSYMLPTQVFFKQNFPMKAQSTEKVDKKLLKQEVLKLV